MGFENTPYKVQVQLDYLYELGSGGEKLGAGGPPDSRHSIESFATQEFSISDPVETIVSGVAASQITLTSQVGEAGIIELYAYIFSENGTLNMENGDVWDVTQNDVKFNIRLSNWTFCVAGNPCGNKDAVSDGEMIDVAVEIKVLGGENDGDSNDGDSNDENTGDRRKLEEVQADSEIDLEGNIALYLSSKVQVDGTWQDMADGYLIEQSKNQKVLYIFRFPKFGDGAVYDPLVRYSMADETVSDNDSASSTVGVFLPTLLVVFWGALRILL